jgi:hypothetical protein
MLIKRKKGEMTTEQIVLIIILIVSFVIILFFLLRLNLGKTSDAETCHNSVATRAAGVLPKESIPLNCKTRYICISKDGSCETMNNAQIEKAKTKEEVYSILANQMADCWWMFGEGELNYVEKDLTRDLYCSICATVSFDNSINFFDNDEIDKKEFYSYLSKTNISEGQSYLTYLNGISTASQLESILKESNSDFGTLSLNKQYYVMMGIFSKVGIEKWTVAGAAGFAGLITLYSLGIIVSGGTAIPAYIIMLGAGVGGGAGAFVGSIVLGGAGEQYFLRPSLVGTDSQAFRAFNCTRLSTVG